MITAAAMKRELNGSLAITPNVLDATIEAQTQQLADQLRIADGARKLAEESAEDCEAWAVAARRVADLRKALDENLEMQMQSRATVPEAGTDRLIAELRRRAREENDRQAQAALKPLKKEASRGRV